MPAAQHSWAQAVPYALRLSRGGVGCFRLLAATPSSQINLRQWIKELFSGWWFGTVFIFPYIWNNHLNWLIFFRGFQTTNQFLWPSVWNHGVGWGRFPPPDDSDVHFRRSEPSRGPLIPKRSSSRSLLDHAAIFCGCVFLNNLETQVFLCT